MFYQNQMENKRKNRNGKILEPECVIEAVCSKFNANQPPLLAVQYHPEAYCQYEKEIRKKHKQLLGYVINYTSRTDNNNNQNTIIATSNNNEENNEENGKETFPVKKSIGDVKPENMNNVNNDDEKIVLVDSEKTVKIVEEEKRKNLEFLQSRDVESASVVANIDSFETQDKTNVVAPRARVVSNNLCKGKEKELTVYTYSYGTRYKWKCCGSQKRHHP